MRYLVNVICFFAQIVLLTRVFAWVKYAINKLRKKDANKPSLSRLLSDISGKDYIGIIVWSLTAIGIVLILLLKFFPQRTIGSPIEAADYTADYYVLVAEERYSNGRACPAKIHVTSVEYEDETDGNIKTRSSRHYYLLEITLPNGRTRRFEDGEVDLSLERMNRASELDLYLQLTRDKID